MPLATTRDGRVYTIIATGHYSVAEMKGELDAILAAADLPADARLLLDIRASASVVKRPVSELRAITDHFIDHADHFGRRVAIVVDGAVRYGLMRMAATWAGLAGVTVHVCTEVEEARTQLLAK